MTSGNVLLSGGGGDRPGIGPGNSRHSAARLRFNGSGKVKTRLDFPAGESRDDALVDADPRREFTLRQAMLLKILGKIGHAAFDAQYTSRSQGVAMHVVHLPVAQPGGSIWL